MGDMETGVCTRIGTRSEQVLVKKGTKSIKNFLSYEFLIE